MSFIISKAYNEAANFVPKEVKTVATGVALTATANVALSMMSAFYKDYQSNILKNVLYLSCGATALAGFVLTVHATIHLGQKLILKRDDFKRAAITTAVGIVACSVIEAIGEHFWKVAPSFSSLAGRSLVYAIATNLAWQACAVTAAAGLVFIGYAAYRVGVATFASATTTLPTK